jgi:hypothetical protein
MKSNSKSSRILERYGMIEALESRIAPAAVGTLSLPTNPVYRTVVAGGGSIGGTTLLLKAGDVLTTGSGGGGSYLMFVSQGEILVHITDLNNDGQIESNEITGISVGAGASFTSLVDIHGDIVTDLNPDGTLSHNGAGDILLDNNIVGIDLRSLTASDFTGNSNLTAVQMANNHLALTSYSIFGNIYAGGGIGSATNANSGLHIDSSGLGLISTKFNGGAGSGVDNYVATTPVIGSIYAGSSASGKSFSFGSSGTASDVFGNLLAFTPSPGEAGASIYNISSGAPGEYFSIGTIHAGDGGFNGAGGNIVNVALQGDNAGTYKLIAGNAGAGTVGQSGGSIINFSETGAFISEVVLQSGSGGSGLTGAGGNAGNITFNSADSTVEINAHFALQYGSGGNGYTKGGTGGGTSSATFITPVGAVTTPLNLVTTMHSVGSIGNTTPIDFNGDGISDAVFSTASPNQVVVALGANPADNLSVSGQFGLNSSGYIYLNSPANVDSITVGDFTGNGHPDIAIASGSASNAGIEVYLSEYSPAGKFIGFSDPLFSPLPSLDNYGLITNVAYTGAVQITKIVSGDFTNIAKGKPITDLAVLVQENEVGGGVAPVLIFLNAETNATHPYGSGYFFANTQNGNAPYLTFAVDFNVNQSTFIATALKTYTPGAGHDVVFESGFNDKVFNIISNLNGEPAVIGGAGWGKVLPPGDKDPVQFHDQAFTVTQDPNNINIADVVAVSQNPQAFIVTLQGDGTGNFNVTSGVDAGLNLAYGTNVEPVGIVAIPARAEVNGAAVWSDVAVLDYNQNGGDYIDYVQVTLAKGNAAINPYYIAETAAPIARGNIVAFGAYVPEVNVNVNLSDTGPTEVGFITADPLTAYQPGGQVLDITQPLIGTGVNLVPFALDTFAPFKVAGYFLVGGNGGNSQAGAAGAGGSFGKSLTVSQVATTTGETVVGTGTLSIAFPADLTYEGTLNIKAGDGGNGFSAGGAGGSLAGISLTYGLSTSYDGTALLFAGNGGQSLAGVGGAGGSEQQLYIVSGEVFVAGNGGIGVVGGAGGNLVGDLVAGLTAAQSNNVNPIIILKAGDGATGITGGGNGGSIVSWVNQFNSFTYGVGGLLNYTAGNGGSAVGGQAGAGGSLVNDSPATFQNYLVGDIYLQGGAGGNGLYGGAGGGISNFAQVSTFSAIPTTTTFIAGAGGNASIGAGGAGGSISGVSASSTGEGVLYTFNFSNPSLLTDPNNAIASEAYISYNRMVAGQGGNSSAGIGGAGGSIGGKTAAASSQFNIDTASVGANSANVIAAGAGGSGLIGGGAGGNVYNVTADAGSAAGGKVVVIAGDGGASTGAAANVSTNAIDVAEATGAINGPGGRGGTINLFQQSTSVFTHVDLIAGNGGATPNHGTTIPNSFVAGHTTTDNSGVGGSVTNIALAGSIGVALDNSTDEAVAIKSYNDLLGGQSMQQFVDNYILGTGVSNPMSDTVGNVGLVAGAAGRVYGGTAYPNGLPSANGISGSVNNISAANIMSMVAGNVEQVAQIQSLTNYSVNITGGVYGSTKLVAAVPYSGTLSATLPNYISPSGDIVNSPLPGGGVLLDGAFVAKNIRNPKSIRDFSGTV